MNFYLIYYLNILNENGFNVFSDVTEYVDNNKNHFNNKKSDILKETWYQSRIGGFLAERLFTIYVSHNFNRILEVPIFSNIQNIKIIIKKNPKKFGNKEKKL